MDILPVVRIRPVSIQKPTTQKTRPEAQLRMEIARIQSKLEAARKDALPPEAILGIEQELASVQGALSKELTNPIDPQSTGEAMTLFETNNIENPSESSRSEKDKSDSQSNSSPGGQLNVIG